MNRRAVAIVGAGVLMIAVGAVGASSAAANADNQPATGGTPAAMLDQMTNQQAKGAAAMTKATGAKAAAPQKKASVRAAPQKKANGQAKATARGRALQAKSSSRAGM